MENENKKTKTPKVKKAKKQMPEGYIGRPKPMKTREPLFHKPTVGFYIGLGIFVILAAFITYIVIRLVNVEKIKDRDFDFYEYDAEKQPESYTLESDDLIFNLDPTTTTFTVTQKATGFVWYSNDPDVDKDAIALPKEKNNMKSPYLIKYSTENGVTDIYDVYTNSVKRNFYTVSKKNNEVRVDYTVGQMDREYKIPFAIYAKEMDAYLEQMTKSNSNAILRYYTHVVLDELEGTKRTEMLEKYEDLKNDDLYIVRDLRAFEKEKAESLFEKINYTTEDFERHKAQYKESIIKEVPQFNLSVIYKIEGDSLKVEIPFDEISYKNTYPITQLSVLPYFGSANVDDKGFILVPEGGGSLINFNNGKTRQNGYYADVYGWDYASDRQAVIKETRTAFPVFGVSYEDANSSFICIMNEGAEYAGVTAEIAGKLANYNYVRADYKMLHSEKFEVSTRNTSAQYSYEETLPVGESIVQTYKFINSSSYVDMAKSYRNYLFGNTKKVNDSETPLVIEVIGAVDKVQQVAGLPKTLPYKLTDYAQAADIINDVETMGFKNVQYKLSGFINDGVRQKQLEKFKFIDALGGKSGFKKMLKSVSDTSAKLYLDGSVQYARQASFWNGFSRYGDPARFVSSEICELYEYSPVWYGKLEEKDPYYLLKPSNISKSFDTFLKNGKKYNIAGLSYSDTGMDLSADYNDHKVVTRAQAADMQVEKLKNVTDAGLQVMVNAGNDYVLPEVSMITNLDLHGNKYAILDKDVPFYQIALHGYKDFTGSPINLGYENDQIVLENAESGAGLYYVVMNANERILQETDYSKYYAACYDSWRDRIKLTYERYNNEVGKVRNATISDHKYLTNDVTVTTFDNGYDIYVNYGYVEYVTDAGVVIPAREYKVLQEAK